MASPDLQPGDATTPPATRPARLRRAYLALVAIAVLSRVVAIGALPIGSESDMIARTGDEKYYFSIAHALIDRGTFVEGSLRAYRPPAYPALLAALVGIFGVHAPAVLQWVQNAFYLGAAALLVWLARRLAGDRVALVAGALLVASPLWLTLPQEAYSESLFVLLIAGALWAQDRAARSGTVGAAALLGLLLGASALTREIGLVMGAAILLMLFLALRSSLGARVALTRIVASAVVLALVVGAWTARNYAVFGRLVPVSTNGPINLYMGNNPRATGDFKWALPDEAQRIWNTPSSHSRNELAAADIAAHEAMAYMRAHPGRTVEMFLLKGVHFWWQPAPGPFRLSAGVLARWLRALFFLVFTGAALVGAWHLRQKLLARTILTVAVAGCLVHAATYFNLRYRAPFDALLAVPAAWALVQLFDRARRARPAS